MRIAVRCFLFCSLLLCLASLASAAVYRWVDADGKKHFSDTPPADSAAQEMVLPYTDPAPVDRTLEAEPSESSEPSSEETSSTSSKPAKAVAPRPSSGVEGANVDIYVTDSNPYCRKAESWFRSRNIPFSAYDIEKDSSAAQRKASLSSSPGVPLVVICGRQVAGYSPMAFEEAMKQCR